MRINRLISVPIFVCLHFVTLGTTRAAWDRANAVMSVDFAVPQDGVTLHHGTRRTEGQFGGALEFTSPLQYAEISFSHKLQGARAVSIGGWFFSRRPGEQCFLFRGVPETGPLGELFFRPSERWVNFLLGTDQRGFLMGTINGNGLMPFPRVTVNEVAFGAWSQLVVVKTMAGLHKFYLNGAFIHTDENAVARGEPRPFRDLDGGEPVRLAVPLGGLIGEAWVFPRELSADEIQRDFTEKQARYHPAIGGRRTLLREMNSHPGTSLWTEEPTAEGWPAVRTHLTHAAMKVMGDFPSEKVPLDPKVISEENCGTYLRRKISLQVQGGDRMPAYLLIPHRPPGRKPAVVCFYGTTGGAGKETTVGLSGSAPGSPPERNHAFAIDMVEAGFVALAPDYLRDGERIEPGERPYDTAAFYRKFPDWSVHGKDAWDTSRAIDYLETLEFVDANKIGMTGHSYGGHSAIFTAAVEPRIKTVVANGPVSDFLHHGLHWGVLKGASHSQSMPALAPYVRDHTLPLPIAFYQWTALIAPRPLLVGQAAGERRPMEEENYAAVKQVYTALGHGERVRYHWYAGDHDYPPEARQAAVAWFRRWLSAPP